MGDMELKPGTYRSQREAIQALSQMSYPELRGMLTRALNEKYRNPQVGDAVMTALNTLAKQGRLHSATFVVYKNDRGEFSLGLNVHANARDHGVGKKPAELASDRTSLAGDWAAEMVRSVSMQQGASGNTIATAQLYREKSWYSFLPFNKFKPVDNLNNDRKSDWRMQ